MRAETVPASRPAEAGSAGENASIVSPPAAPNPPRKHDFWTEDRFTGDWGGLRSDLEEAGLEFGLSYQTQWQQNFRGGRQTRNGGRITGSYDLDFDLDFKKLGLIPRNADFELGYYIKAKGDHNDSIQDRTGSLNDPNADPADDKAIYVRKWWFWSKFFDEKLDIRLGLVQTHKDLFDVSLYANHEDRDFLSRWSFRNPTIPHEAGMGAFVKVEPVEGWYLQAATLDAQAERYHTQFDTAFHEEDWYIGIWETGLTPEWQTAKGPMPGRYRIGFWYDPTLREVFEDLDDDEEPELRGRDMGLYAGLDQMAWKENDDPKDDQGLGLFTRFGGRPGDVHRVSCYWEAGASYTGLIPDRDRDTLGFAWTNGIVSDRYRNEIDPRADAESVYEWYYRCFVTPWLTVSPDFQVIANPGGTRDARDAIVGGVRVQVVF